MKVAVVVAVLIPSLAIADEKRTLGEGYEVHVASNGLHVAKGKQRARLADALSIKKASLDKKARSVDVEVEDYSCEGSHRYTWTLGHLDARLENTAAYALHKKKDFKASAAGFTRAVAADPTWHIPAYNLASAQQLLGDKAAAAATLAPWLASAPIPTYVQVTTDPELSPLLDRPELVAVRAKKPGKVKLTAKGIDGDIAYDSVRGLLAVTRTEGSWGSSAFTTELEIYDVATGKRVANTPLIRWDETSNECYDETGCELVPGARPAIAKRAKQLQTMLDQLGFAKPKVETGTAPAYDESGDKQTVQLKKAKLGVVAKDGTVRVLQKDTVLGQASIDGRISRVDYLEGPKVVLVSASRAGAEGCEATDPTYVHVIKLGAPAK